ncbi:hypothetical protein NQ318_008715 [Aromia moschata]|uniref:Uncharacterized protein n=1 Tax=Aromia moschata TaxID=1265417 RepID=A0AAV8Y4M7_9CUCU|nr:hypothetical protein NQ318_008715 [Aromia moschata]
MYVSFADETTPRNLVPPKIDYDQWKPLGRGDPLKNDPTYDYVPPVLDRVHYWVDPALRKPDPPAPGENQKTEILLLGITSKKPAISSPQADSRRDTYDPYVKYVPGSNYSPNSNQRIARPSFIPSLPTSFFPSFFSPNKNKYTDNKYTDRATFSKGNEQRVPYTMLVPPPVDTKNSINSLPETASPPITQKPAPAVVYTTSPPATTLSPLVSGSSSVTVQAANLVYQSSSLSDATEFNSNKGNHISSTSSITWEPSITTTKTIPDYREDLVYNTHLSLPESFAQLEFAPTNYSNRPLVAADSNQNVNYVTPPPLLDAPNKEVMFKGHVTDDSLDISNTYVKIGKPEAEVHSTGLGMSDVEGMVHSPMSIVPPNVVMFPHMVKSPQTSSPSLKSEFPPLTMQTLQEMQTMHPPPVTQNPIFTKSTNAIITVLEKEKSRPTVLKDLSSSQDMSNLIGSSSSQTNTVVTLLSTTSEKATTTTTTAEPPTTFTTSLTTDPLFKHYKQPMEPLRGPLYLIIQGHSKVKTYGPSKQINGILIQDTNEISDDKYEKTDFEVRHLHDIRKEMMHSDDQQRQARTGNLQTLKHLIQTGFGAIDLSGIDVAQKRNGENVQEAELQVGYKVEEENNGTTETYHKGIVEEARKLNM